MLDVSLRTIQLWVENGALRAWKTPGGHRRIFLDSINEQLKQRKTGYSPPQKPRPSSHSLLKVIAVDDDPVQLELVKVLTSRSAVEVSLITASDGYEGLVLIGKNKPDLAIIDLSMPNINGFDMIRALSQNESTSAMKMLVITGLNQQQIKMNGGLPDFVSVISKPVSFEQLETVLKQTATAVFSGP